MRPIGDPRHPPMFDGIEVYIVEVRIEIPLIPDHVLPESPLPNAPFVFRPPLDDNRSPGAMARAKEDLIKRQRVEESASFGGNVQMQWR
jgi:hypothetical protein